MKEEELKTYGKDIEIKNVETSNEEAYFYVIVDDGIYKVSLKGAEYIGKRNTNNIELAKGDIEFVYDPTDWTNGKVKVEIKANKSIDGYDLEYKTKDNNIWTKYIKELEVDKNQDIYARLSGVLGQTSVATGTVANIDRLEPNDFTPEVTSTTNTITVTASTTDKEKTDDYKCSGIYGYRFSKDNGSTWTSYQTSGTYTFNGLTQNTTYNIKVEAKDKAGNTTQGSINKATGKVPSSISIGYSTQSWTNGNVVVTASSNVSGYTLQYNNGNGWSTYPSSGITRTSNGNVYFRLWDGVNAGDTATATVGNIDKLPPTINISLKAYKKAIQIVASAEDATATKTDGNSGIIGYRFSKDNGATWTNYQTGNNYIFDDLYGNLKGETYNIKVETKDKAGNIKQTSQSATTTCLNNTYYKNYTFKLCTISGRKYNKISSEGTINALAYYNTDGSHWVNVLTIGNTEQSVSNDCDYDNKVHTKWKIKYNNQTYYCSNAHAMPGENGLSIDTNLVILNSYNSEYSALYEAYLALLDRYYN